MLIASHGFPGKMFAPYGTMEYVTRMRREMERLFSTLKESSDVEFPAVEFPAVNVWNSEGGLLITAELAGVKPEEIEVTVAGKTLTIKGSRAREELAEGENRPRAERWHGTFAKTMELPFTVEADKVEAKFANGVIHLTLPRVQADRPRKITVKSN
jgi:HSP20 family protein